MLNLFYIIHMLVWWWCATVCVFRSEELVELVSGIKLSLSVFATSTFSTEMTQQPRLACFELLSRVQKVLEPLLTNNRP